METKILIIAVVQKGNQVLLRKKPDGSPPYKETWYLFGGELVAGSKPEKILQGTLKAQAGINIKLVKELGWDTEVKKDHDGVEKMFVYLDAICEYVDGEIVPSPEIEKLEWVDFDKLKDYDLVPPSRKLFSKLSYFK